MPRQKPTIQMHVLHLEDVHALEVIKARLRARKKFPEGRGLRGKAADCGDVGGLFGSIEGAPVVFGISNISW